MGDQDLKDRKQVILRISGQILAADVANGLRDYWIYEMSDEKMDKVINASVRIANRLADKVYEE